MRSHYRKFMRSPAQKPTGAMRVVWIVVEAAIMLLCAVVFWLIYVLTPP